MSLAAPVLLSAQLPATGEDIIDAISLKDGHIKLVSLYNKQPLFFKYYSERPTKVRIHIEALNKSLQSSKLLVQIIRRIDSKPDTAILEQKEIAANDSSVVFDALESIYLSIKPIELKNKIKLSVSIKKIADIQAIPISIQNGKSFQFHFEKFTKTFFCSANIPERSLVEFEINSELIDTSRRDYLKYYQTASISIINENNKISPFYSVKTDKHTMRFMFILDSGSYVLDIYLSEFGYPQKMLSPENEMKEATLKIVNVKKQPLPDEIQTFYDWFNESDLNQYMSLNFFSDNILKDTSLPKEIVSSAIETRNYIGTLRCAYLINDSLQRKMTVDSILFGIPLAGKTYEWIDSTQFPITFLYFDPKSGVAYIEDFERAFYKRNDITVWGKIFQKLRLTNGFLPYDLFFYVPVPCSGGLVYLDNFEDEFSLGRSGEICLSARSSVQLQTLHTSLNSHNNVPVRNTSYVFNKNDIDKLFRLSVFDSIFNNKNQKLTFFEVDDTYFEFTTSGLKNVILKGRNYWEKITVRGILRADNGKQSLDIIVDGLFTTGIGNAPKNESQYDKNFEPKYFSNLTEFARICTQTISDHLKN